MNFRPLRTHPSALAVASLFAAAVVLLPWWRVNLSPSLPRGLYRLHAVPDELRVGMLVLLDVPESVHQWHSKWVPLLKPIAGLASTVVCEMGGLLWVDGAYYGRVWDAAGGQALPRWAGGCRAVPAGHVFVASKVPRSLDSRYIGPVPVTQIKAVASPLLTWGE